MTKVVLISGLLLFLLLASCRKLEEYPVEPEITYEGFVFLQDVETGTIEKGLLQIGYRDGDGDIGLDQGDTLFPYHRSGEYYYNLIIRYFERQNGRMVEVPLLSWNPVLQQFDTSTFSARVPPLISKDQHRPIKGIIEDELFVVNPLSQFDTIQFKIKLIDRALNISNEVESDLIIIPRP